MGLLILAIFAITLLCWIAPPVLIVYSSLTSGPQKRKWVIRAVLSAIVPFAITCVPPALLFLFGKMALTNGPLSIVMGVVVLAASIGSYALPWFVYGSFRRHHRKSVSVAPRPAPTGSTR